MVRLTGEVAGRLHELEAVIERGLEAFVEVGNAIREIRDSRLYRERYATFEDYCRERWGWGRNYVNKQVVAADTAALVGTNVPIANEAQARALAPLAREDPEAARAVWAEAVEEAKRRGRRPTAAGVRERVAARGDAPDPSPSLAPPTVLFGGDDPPAEPGALAEALGGGRAVALSAGASVENAQAFLDAASKAATEAGREAHLLVYCSPDRKRARAAERALLRRSASGSGRRDPVLDALPFLAPKLAEESSGLSGSRSTIQLLTGVALSREEGAEPRLVLRFGALRLSVPVPAENVEDLVDPVVAWHFPRAYKAAAAAGGAVRFASFLPDNTLEIKAGARRLSLYAHPTDDLPRYPRASEGEGKVSYAAGDLKRAIDRVLPFVSTDETRPVLTAVRIEGRGGGTRLVATDSYRMICDDTLRGTAPPKDAAAVVEAGDLRLLSRLLARSEPEARVALALVGGGAGLVASGALADATRYEAVWRPVDGRFPEYEKYLPDEAELARFGLPAEEALGALEASSVVRSDHGVDPVVVAFGRASATIAVETEEGEFSQTMDAVVPEDAAVRGAAFNPANLAAALRARAGGGRMAWLGLNQEPEHAPWTLKPVAVGKDVAVMPMRQPKLGQREGVAWLTRVIEEAEAARGREG